LLEVKTLKILKALKVFAADVRFNGMSDLGAF
jgi:hypothetical protein